MRLPIDVQISINLLHKIDRKPQSVRLLAKELEITEFFLHQIVRKLKKNNLIQAVRGKGGGITSIGKPVSLFDLYQALEHKLPVLTVGERLPVAQDSEGNLQINITDSGSPSESVQNKILLFFKKLII